MDHPPPANGNQFVDIHPVTRRPGEFDRPAASRQPSAGPVKFRGAAGFNRQVSLEAGAASVGMEARDSKSGGVVGGSGAASARADDGKEDVRVLSRSGKSVGALRVEAGSRKADFSMFRTKSGISKQNSMLPVRKDSEADLCGLDGAGGGGGGGVDHSGSLANQTVPVGRYFAALRGPELDQVRDYEDILLPKDELWPFLLRFPIGCYGICLGLGSQCILWGALASSPATQFLRVGPAVNLCLWFLALAALFSVSVTYGLKLAFYFEAVRREYHHPVRVNFFFAPWIVCMFMCIGLPPALGGGPGRLHPGLWCAFMLPVVVLELKIYGQWLSGGKRRLCKVANPSSHLSIVGNFVGAILAARVGWYEPAKFLWAVGLAHYLVLFVTLYQRLPTSEALPKELHPVYSMFIAAPSAASIAWEDIYGGFDEVSRTCYFVALFLYTSLVVRLNFFRGFKFSVAWWSYTFPMTTASLATIRYAEEVPCLVTRGLAVSLSIVSSTMVSVLFVSTILHALVWRSLFPNDLAIAITKSKVAAAAAGGGGKVKKGGGRRKSLDDIKRWAKNNPLSSLVTSVGNGGGGNADKSCDADDNER